MVDESRLRKYLARCGQNQEEKISEQIAWTERKKKSRNIKRSEKRGECWDPRTLDNTGDSSEAI